MARIDDLEQAVRGLYEQELPGRDDWVGWLYQNHVFVVADYATDLAKRFGADVDLSRAAAMLHDLADYKMERKNPNHEEESLKYARKLMQEHGYSAEEIALVVDDAVRYHSCHNGQRPKSKEGLVLATADALAHLLTDTYVYFTWAFGKDRSLEELKEWARKKVERDFHDKIAFDEVREEVRADYELWKNVFAR